MLQFRYPDKPLETTPEIVIKLSTSEWIGQAKYDGWRLNLYFDGGHKVRCLTRQANDLHKINSTKFSLHLAEQISSLSIPANSVLDTEFVGPRGNHNPTVYIFDCLAWNGEWLTNCPFEQRWLQFCRNLVQLPMSVKLADTFDCDFMSRFSALKEDWRKRGDLSLTEGIVLKHRQGKLDLSTRSSTKNNRMLKCKFRDIRGKRF